MVILIDMDGPLADFERGFLEEWKRQFPEEEHVPLDQRRTFYVRDDYPEELREKIESIYFSPRFYENLPVVPGSLEVIEEILRAGHEVRLCTAPLSRYENCVAEKYLWVDKNFGKDFVKRIILAKDKTLIFGDILFDDKPVVSGLLDPVWEHVVFSTPYNRDVTGRVRIGWEDIQEFISSKEGA